jgi:hypothetical protein
MTFLEDAKAAAKLADEAAAELDALPDIADSVLSFEGLMALEIPERKLLLPFLPQASNTMIFGPPGIGKTYFTLSLAVSLSCGVPFMKWDVPSPTGVLYIDGEMPLALMKTRLKELHPGETIAPLELLSHEYFFQMQETDLALCDDYMQSQIKGYLESRQDIGCVIIDNLSCLLPTVREDKRDQWARRVMPFLLWLRRRQLATVMLHHSGKDAAVQRGTSSRRDALDTEIWLQKIGEETEGAHFGVHFTKSRGLYGDAITPFEARLTQDSPPTWACLPIVEGNMERVLTLVQDGVGSVTETAEELNLTKGAVSKIAKKLRNEGKLGPGPELRLI